MPNVANFLKERLIGAGINVVFGVPGDYILSLYKKIEDDPQIELVGTTDEAHAGFAADAFARVNGIGCVAVTYNVGALKIMNPIAGAFEERSPVVVLVGSPGMKEREEGLRLHHTVRSHDTQRQIFEHITCAQAVLNDPATAAYEIDRVLTALKVHRQPVYIEVPRDMIDRSISYDLDQGTPTVPTSDAINLDESLVEVTSWIEQSKNPVILAGVELSRFGLGEKLVKFAERTNIPMFTEALSKSVVGERHPLFGGVYTGTHGPAAIRDVVENSDCILMLGVMLTDIVIGGDKPQFTSRQTVRANVGSLRVKNHGYNKIVFPEFCEALFKREIAKKPAPVLYKKSPAGPFEPVEDKPLTTARFFEKVDSIISKDMAIITDVGDSLFGGLDLTVHHANTFISPAYYTSMGMAIPAALGVKMARPETRPLVIVGDGAFQMSVSEISTLFRRKTNAIVCVLNNRGYTTERFILDGKFNDIADWNYDQIGMIFVGEDGDVSGQKAETEGQLDRALTHALARKDRPTVINAIVGQKDVSTALGRVTAGLKKRV